MVSTLLQLVCEIFPNFLLHDFHIQKWQGILLSWSAGEGMMNSNPLDSNVKFLSGNKKEKNDHLWKQICLFPFGVNFSLFEQRTSILFWHFSLKMGISNFTLCVRNIHILCCIRPVLLLHPKDICLSAQRRGGTPRSLVPGPFWWGTPVRPVAIGHGELSQDCRSGWNGVGSIPARPKTGGRGTPVRR